MMKSKIKRILQITIPTLLLLAAVIYRIPITYSGETIATDINSGNTVPMQYDITVKKYLFKPTVYSGEFTIDGKRYADGSIFSERYLDEGVNPFASEADRTFTEKLKDKFQNATPTFYCVDPDPADYPEFRGVNEYDLIFGNTKINDSFHDLCFVSTRFTIKGKQFSGMVVKGIKATIKHENSTSHSGDANEYTAALH